MLRRHCAQSRQCQKEGATSAGMGNHSSFFVFRYIGINVTQLIHGTTWSWCTWTLVSLHKAFLDHRYAVGRRHRGARLQDKQCLGLPKQYMATWKLFPDHLPLFFSSLLKDSSNTPARSSVRYAVLYWNWRWLQTYSDLICNFFQSISFWIFL